MKKRIATLAGICFLLLGAVSQAQQAPPEPEIGLATPLFREEAPLPVRLRYSDREMRKETNDSTSLDVMLSYQAPDGAWDSLEVTMRARGNWRKEHCFLTPVKLKIKKSERGGSLFEGDKELKMVLPCRNTEAGQDYVLKEYLAYKLYEVVSPYHFKTRRLAIDFTDLRGAKEKQYRLEGFLIEDIRNTADRCHAKRLKRHVHPLQQNDYCSIQNDFFQYMIGNTDFSVAYQHNQKLLFVEGMGTLPVPYDFDMCGLVDANYAVVSQVQGETLEITDVTQRLYRGFRRDPGLYAAVREEYRSKKGEFMARVDALEPDFHDPGQFQRAREFILEFFRVLEDDARYSTEILEKMRTR